MERIKAAMHRGLWGVYRIYGLACLGLAILTGEAIANFGTNYVPRAEQWPYLWTQVALMAGGLVMLPATTPAAIRHVRTPGAALAAMAAILGMSVALISALRLAFATRPDLVAVLPPGLAVNLIALLAMAGVVSAGVSGLSAPRPVRRRLPLMPTAARHCGELPRLPSSSRYS